MTKMKRFLKEYRKECVAVFIFLLCLGIFSVSYALAAVEPVKSIVITSQNANYDNGEPGSWKVEKSGRWTGYGEAEVTFDIDTVSLRQDDYSDIIFVLDVSNSMLGSKLQKVKDDINSLLDTFLSSSNNRAGLITFSSNSQIVSGFTNDRELLQQEINQLEAGGETTYYDALVNVDTMLKNYTKEDNRSLMVLFLTDGLPNVNTPNQVGEYQYLKEKYPYLIISGVQYEMGNHVLSPIKEISDRQFVADMDSLNNVLFDASINPIIYQKYQVIDYVDNRYFTVESEKSLTVSDGEVTLEEEEGRQKITWSLSNLASGNRASLTVKLKLNDSYLNSGGVYPTNESTEVISEIDDLRENVTTTNTPILADNYTVTYDENAPEGCSVSNVPGSNNYSVYSTVAISNQEPKCEGYQFNGWGITNQDAKKVGNDYFIMPESDVVIKAEWSKVTAKKTMDGSVSTAPTLYDMMNSKAVMDNVRSEFVDMNSGIDFSSSSSDYNGKGVYMRAGTEEEEYPILYYRGDVDDNHLLLGNMCFRIVRTTDTGGIKLLYDGEANNGVCDNTGTDTAYGFPAFNTDNRNVEYGISGGIYASSLVNAGYMYGKVYDSYPYIMFEKGDINYYYGNDVTWNGSSYTLVDTVTSSPVNWSSDRDSAIGNKHRYTCFSTSTTCSEVNYIYDTTNARYTSYVKLTDGAKIDDALLEMTTESTNTTNSSIKDEIDEWYIDYIQVLYSSYIEDTVYCNDRSVYQKNSWDKDFTGTRPFYFATYGRILSGTPDISCSNRSDTFTVSSDNGNGNLNYPVGLLTADEVILAGGSSSANSSYYLNIGQYYWTMSPQQIKIDDVLVYTVDSRGALEGANGSARGLSYLRPVIAIKDMVVASGDGTSNNPYQLLLE